MVICKILELNIFTQNYENWMQVTIVVGFRFQVSVLMNQKLKIYLEYRDEKSQLKSYFDLSVNFYWLVM